MKGTQSLRWKEAKRRFGDSLACSLWLWPSARPAPVTRRLTCTELTVASRRLARLSERIHSSGPNCSEGARGGSSGCVLALVWRCVARPDRHKQLMGGHNAKNNNRRQQTREPPLSDGILLLTTPALVFGLNHLDNVQTYLHGNECTFATVGSDQIKHGLGSLRNSTTFAFTCISDFCNANKTSLPKVQ